MAFEFRGTVLPDRAVHSVYVVDGRVTDEPLPHGRIAEEVIALHESGLSADDALAAGSWRARSWLGVEHGLAEGSTASFVVYPADPRDLAVLRHPSHVVLRGHVFRP